MGLYWVDLVIIATLIFFAIEALRRSLILELLDFASFLIAGLLSFSYYNFPAGFFESRFYIPHGLTLILGFMTVWFLSEMFFYLLVRLIFPKIPKFKILESKLLSLLPALARSLIFIALILVMIATFPIQPAIKKNVLDSKIGSMILKIAYGLEYPVKQVFGGMANDSLTFLTIEPKTDKKVKLGFQTDRVTLDFASEKTMFGLVNKEREKRGIKTLVFDEKLRDIARAHSSDMFLRGYFSHYSPEGKTVADRALKAEIDFLVVGENLAYAPSVEQAEQGLMNSPGHRANILSTDYARVGIGAVDSNVYGKMFTQVFAD